MQPIDHKTIIASLEEELAGLDAKKEAFLAIIDARRATLERLIKGHKELIEIWSVAGSAISEKPREQQVTLNIAENIPKNIFKNKTIIEGTLIYLNMAGTGKTSRELGEAFVKGGMRKKADKYFFDTIRTALRRRADKNGIIKIDDRYWLAEWPHTPKTGEDINTSSENGEDTTTEKSDLLTDEKAIENHAVNDHRVDHEEHINKTHTLLRAIHQNGSKGATAAEIYHNIINNEIEFDRDDVYKILGKQVIRGRVKKIGYKAHLTESGLKAIQQ